MHAHRARAGEGDPSRSAPASIALSTAGPVHHSPSPASSPLRAGAYRSTGRGSRGSGRRLDRRTPRPPASRTDCRRSRRVEFCVANANDLDLESRFGIRVASHLVDAGPMPGMRRSGGHGGSATMEIAASTTTHDPSPGLPPAPPSDRQETGEPPALVHSRCRCRRIARALAELDTLGGESREGQGAPAVPSLALSA